VKGIGFETAVEDWFVTGNKASCCSCVSWFEGESRDIFAISVSAIAISDCDYNYWIYLSFFALRLETFL
jgi:hypothetical protein